ncbi:MAG: carboxypeptidase-like regulatory domain-containing protein [Tepidisphaeraceae bacterium]|jgi:5-hydroxyisourate hydrolase-like protein (transthyretin family)
MFRSINSVALVLAAFALAVLASHAVKADDSATSQPSASNGSITVTVVDPDSNPVNKVTVKIYTKVEGHSKALNSAKTGKDGKCTFSALANGDYKLTASKKSIGKGSATVSVTDDSANPSITINLASADAGNGGATTAPSAQAQ